MYEFYSAKIKNIVDLLIKYFRPLILSALLLCGLAGPAYSGVVRDYSVFRVYHSLDSSSVKTVSSSIIDTIVSLYNKNRTGERILDFQLSIRSNSSIEGSLLYSRQLNIYRANHLFKLLVSRGIDPSKITIVPSWPFNAEPNRLFASLTDIPEGIDTAAIHSIMIKNAGSKLHRSITEYDPSGRSWDWFSRAILTPSRYCEIVLYYEYITTLPDEKLSANMPEYHQECVRADTPLFNPKPAGNVTSHKPVGPSPSSVFRIGTNLLYDIATVANVHLECGFSKNFALSLLVTYSPWDIRNDFKIRTLLFQPEFRYYFAKGFRGHYVGVEAHAGWYNVAFKDSRTRYQDTDGSTPLWGGGLVYGYVVPFSKHWGMDFSIGVGYSNLDYDLFYNVTNGARYGGGHRDCIGPTKLGVSIFYKF